MEQTLKKHSKGRFKVGNLEYDGLFTRWIRLCIGVAVLGATAGVLLLSASPFLLALAKVLHGG